MVFRSTLVRHAENASKRLLNARDASASLLPPIPLYRHILRAHRSLPYEMRSLGDVYVKSEFRLHRNVDTPSQKMAFLSQWKMYLDELTSQGAGNFRGKKLDPTVFEKMSSEQLSQLYEVMNAAKDVWNPDAEKKF